ncbi:TPA: hypothetical protein DCL37_06795 [Candidatus Acetothermia bacterium]|nr:hypothetical protein [Candidatus Acetothermia bacterium]
MRKGCCMYTSWESPSEPRAHWGRRYKALFISAILGMALLAAMVWIASPTAVLARLGALGPWGIASFLASSFLSFLCGVQGWRCLLQVYVGPNRFTQTLGIMAGGYAVGYLTPTLHLGGEPVRAVLASQGFSTPGHEVVATIIIEKLLYLVGVTTLLIMGGVIGLRWELPPALRQGVLSFAGTAAAVVGTTLVGIARRATWASRCSGFVLRFLPKWAWLKQASGALERTEREASRALLEDHGKAALKAAVFIFLSVGLSVIAPLIFFAFAYGRILSPGELALFFALSTMFSLFSWLTPGAIGIAEGAYAGIFKIMGLPMEGAVAFALAQKAAALPIVGLGLVYLSRRGVDWFGRIRGKACPSVR